jgi:hypothetical protein
MDYEMDFIQKMDSVLELKTDMYKTECIELKRSYMQLLSLMLERTTNEVKSNKESTNRGLPLWQIEPLLNTIQKICPEQK